MLIGKVEVIIGPKTVEWHCPLHAIDADGSPRAYHPNGRAAGALDYLANAGHRATATSPPDWYGVVTDDGKPAGQPIVQSSRDPAPGFFVSSTALRDRSLSRTSQRSYVDASAVPYLSVPPELLRAGVRLGDLGLACCEAHAVPFVVADVGPHRELGEGSIALAEALGVPSSPIDGGSVTPILFTVYRASARVPSWPILPTDLRDAVAKLCQENLQ
jgi:hypothetical protein